jgi:hypothetical protein
LKKKKPVRAVIDTNLFISGLFADKVIALNSRICGFPALLNSPFQKKSAIADLISFPADKYGIF